MKYPTHPGDLVDSIRSGGLVPLIGAGLSIPRGGKSWDQILQIMIAELASTGFGHEALLDEVQLTLTSSPTLRLGLLDDVRTIFHRTLDPLMVAQVFENVFHRRRLIRVLTDACTSVSGPGPIHDLLVSLGCKIYVTTNFDNLIEQAIKKTGANPQVIVNEENVAYWKSEEVQVVKMHGSLIDPFDPDGIVFSRSDFEAFSVKHPSMDMLVQFLMSTGTLLLLGYSARDPNFLAVHDRVRFFLKRHKRQAYFVSFDLSEPIQDYWKEYGLYPINLDGTNKTASLLAWLTELKRLI
jgi:hypothetical protein